MSRALQTVLERRAGRATRAFAAAASILLLACTQPASVTVHSLDQIRPYVTSPQARAFVAEQLRGEPTPDRLGVKLPAALNALEIARLIVPPSERASASFVGAKPWPGHPGTFVAIVCSGGASPLYPGLPQCAQSDGANASAFHVYLGILSVRGGSVKLIARGGPFVGTTHWNHSGLPRAPMVADDAPQKAIPAEGVVGFDLRPYSIAPGQTAFGVVGSWSEMYSGGGAYFTSLNLYAVEGRRIARVFAAPISAYSDVAGDWHKDQTRDHTITDAALTLVVSTHRTKDHNDVVMRDVRGCIVAIYRWSTTIRRYVRS